MNNLLRRLSPLENRFVYLESKSLREALAANVIGTTVSWVRGGIIGASLAALTMGNDYHYLLAGAGMGMAIDLCQDTIRKINLHAMKRENPEKYINHMKQFYGREVRL